MAKIIINKAKNIIETGPKKHFIKLKNTGGPRGIQGVKGDPGVAATITPGTATTLPAGSAPTVTNSGTTTDAVFNFGIPKGDKGDKGDTGTPGSAATISVGTTTTGDAGTSASVTNSGTSSAAVFNFTIPRGAAGQNGADGEDGESATITVGTTTTLPAGSSATVTNTGTSSAAVLNFGIPKGEKGDSGSGAGDMSMSDYDPNGTVKSAGGIVAYVADEIPTVPTKTSDLTNDGSDGTSTYVEADELATVATSGAYSDLTGTPTIPAAQVNSDWNASSGVAQILNKPTIPTVNDATLTITQNGSTAGTFTANASTNATIALTDTTYSTMTGATSGAAGSSGLVPAPAAGDDGKYLKGDGTWDTVQSGTSTITGTGAPTSSTAADVGQFYLDTQTGNTYVCTSNTGGTYTWDTVGGGVSLTMTTTDPGDGSPLAANTILGVYDGGGITMDYSTSEQATGYTWVDGSMIYKKTISIGTLPNADAKSVAHDISSLGKVIKMEGYCFRPSDSTSMPIPFISQNAAAQISLYVAGTDIVVATGTDRSNTTDAYVTLYYLKSA